MKLPVVIEQYFQTRELKRRFPQAVFEPNVMVKGDLSNLRLGNGVIIQSGTALHAGGLEWCEFAGLLEIGGGSVISPNCVFYGCGPGGISIGENLSCGPGVGIFSSRNDYERGRRFHIFKPVVIGSNVIIYANAVISPGVVIGDASAIAANSVVTNDVPPGVLVGGAPARVIKRITSNQVKAI